MLTFILHETILVQDTSSQNRQFEFDIKEMHVVKLEEVQLDVDSHPNYTQRCMLKACYITSERKKNMNMVQYPLTGFCTINIKSLHPYPLFTFLLLLLFLFAPPISLLYRSLPPVRTPFSQNVCLLANSVVQGLHPLFMHVHIMESDELQLPSLVGFLQVIYNCTLIDEQGFLTCIYAWGVLYICNMRIYNWTMCMTVHMQPSMCC